MIETVENEEEGKTGLDIQTTQYTCHYIYKSGAQIVCTEQSSITLVFPLVKCGEPVHAALGMFEGTDYIVGGKDARFGSFPWMALVSTAKLRQP